MRTDLYYDSVGAGKIHACRWAPEGEPTAVVQIVHGIAEHVERYDQFARYLNKKGYLVVAEDHMGHGKSIDHGGTKGYFDGGWFAAVEDTCRLMKDTQAEFAGLPYILFGHSMGSFLARTILYRYPDCGVSGAVICGTGWMPDAVVKMGHGAAKLFCKRVGERNPSKQLDAIVFGGYNKRVERLRTKYDWLTRDAVIVDAYIADPMCGFTASCGLIRDMLGGIMDIQKKENLAKMKKDLPVLFLAGGDDPVGSYGAGVRQAAQEFQNVGMTCLTTKIFPLCRHEVLNEINRAEVFRTVNIWIRENFL